MSSTKRIGDSDQIVNSIKLQGFPLDTIHALRVPLFRPVMSVP